ncbi:TetR/AcrR family transcriptional regulator [Pseudoroseomonas cervicalis]|uniref:Transcriptional regulator, TetR family n=1 Tax=Pseudoroseomonas cervicalis ATCC 49957 TaxID=525371 RepID=D5RLR2_9PROT|nr:TetR/AcrR family transcriptional regulator [Pseudoroseomonas cervicalis]EFH11755.1 transcriptional regulator, TetR family [Pseudoroseomonas cervicalis ATCC 49957]
MSLAAADPDTDASPKRRAILEAAAALFMAEGLAAVSMDAVARAAGVSKATLYAHFSGKDALFTEIVQGNCRRLQGSVDAALVDHALPLEQALAQLGTGWLGFLLQPKVRALHRVVLAESGRSPELAAAFYQAGPVTLRRWLEQWLEGEKARGRLAPGASETLVAEQFFALLRGDLFMRATLNLAPDISPEAVAAQAAAAARAIVRLYGADAAG